MIQEKFENSIFPPWLAKEDRRWDVQGRGVPEMWLSNHRWVELTAELYDAGCAMSGLIADSRTLIDRARVEAQVSFVSYCTRSFYSAADFSLYFKSRLSKIERCQPLL